MIPPKNEFDDLERLLKTGWQWSEHPPDAPEQDLAAWAEQPTDDPAVEAMLASDPALREAVIDLRRSRSVEGDAPSPALHRRIVNLVPARPSVAGRIGLWAAAAAAGVLLALGGWQLGLATESTRSLDQDSLAVATFGLSSGESAEDASFLTYAHAGEEAQR